GERWSFVRSAMTRPPGAPRPEAVRPDHPLLESLADACADTRYVTGKSGAAYGFVVDNGYVVRSSPPQRIFVSAVVYADRDGTVNDDRYDYQSVSDPLMADLGRSVAAHFCRPSP
ncbi:MAG: hypothetical protein AAGA56_29405, partial [Myxococcota bacterium]